MLVDNYEIKTSLSIISQIYKSAEPTTQLPRLMDAFDACLSFYIALQDENYPLALQRAQKFYDDAKITEEDYNLVVSFIPA